MASILAMAALTIGGWSWYRQREHDRWLRSKLSAEKAFSDAERLGEVARATSDPTRWAEAIKVLEGAQNLLEPGDPDEGLRNRMADALKSYRGQADILETQGRDQRLVTRLEDARLLAVGLYRDMIRQEENDSPSSKLVIDAYRKSFQEYGIDIDKLTPDEAAGLICPSLRLFARRCRRHWTTGCGASVLSCKSRRRLLSAAHLNLSRIRELPRWCGLSVGSIQT
jgi:hypothetical protein